MRTDNAAHADAMSVDYFIAFSLPLHRSMDTGSCRSKINQTETSCLCRKLRPKAGIHVRWGQGIHARWGQGIHAHWGQGIHAHWGQGIYTCRGFLH